MMGSAWKSDVFSSDLGMLVSVLLSRASCKQNQPKNYYPQSA